MGKYCDRCGFPITAHDGELPCGAEEQDPEYSREQVTVRIYKQFVGGEPSHWWVEVDDIDGDFMGAATGPTFYDVWDSAFTTITGDEPEWDSQPQHNEWVDFDANKKND